MLELICSIGVLRSFPHCIGHVTTGSFVGRGNQYLQLVKVLYCKLPIIGKQLRTFPLGPGFEPLTSKVGGDVCYHCATVAPQSSSWRGESWDVTWMILQWVQNLKTNRFCGKPIWGSNLQGTRSHWPKPLKTPVSNRRRFCHAKGQCSHSIAAHLKKQKKTRLLKWETLNLATVR